MRFKKNPIEICIWNLLSSPWELFFIVKLHKWTRQLKWIGFNDILSTIKQSMNREIHLNYFYWPIIPPSTIAHFTPCQLNKTFSYENCMHCALKGYDNFFCKQFFFEKNYASKNQFLPFLNPIYMDYGRYAANLLNVFSSSFIGFDNINIYSPSRSVDAFGQLFVHW